MELSNYFIWIGCISFLYLGISFLQIPLFKLNKLWLKIVTIVLKIGLVIVFAYLNVEVEAFLLWRIPYVTGAFHVVFSAEVVIDLIYLIIGLFKKGKIRVFTRIMVGFMTTLILTLFGTINMQIITPKYNTYKSNLLKNEYKVVFISDLHYGSSQSFSVIDKMFENISKENPDLILLGGDITDEYTTRDEMERLYGKIGGLNIPTYFVYGNHDNQPKADLVGGIQYTEEELYAAITGNGITVLSDDYVTIHDDLVIYGRECYDSPSRKKVEELPKAPEGKFVLCLDHNPYINDDIIKTNATLQLSSHSHAGQYFPLNLIAGMIYKHTSGLYRVDDTDLYVSEGVGGWYVPYRTAGFSNYDVFTLSK